MKDLVEHIRSIHFTILVVTLIITAAMRLEKEKSLDRAATDAEAILRLSERWDDTTKNFIDDLDRAYLKRPKTISAVPTIPSASEETFVKVGTYEVFGENDYLKSQIAKQMQMQSAIVGSPTPAIEEALKRPISKGYFIVNSNWLFVHKGQDGEYRVEPAKKWQTLNDFVRFWDNGCELIFLRQNCDISAELAVWRSTE
jgi:hypothetical protein